MNNIAVFLKKARLNAGLTQGELSKKIGYTSPQFVSNWERGDSQPPLKILPKLVRILKLEKHEIISVFTEQYSSTLNSVFFSKKNPKINIIRDAKNTRIPNIREYLEQVRFVQNFTQPEGI